MWTLLLAVAENDAERDRAAERALAINPQNEAARRWKTKEVRTTAGRERELGTYEMLWDCKFCGSTKLLGKTHRFCPNCGAAQDPKSRYFPADEEKIAVHDHVFVGADRICGSCSTPNSGLSEFCMQCGAPLSEAARASTLAAQSKASGTAFVSSGSRDIEGEAFQAEMQRVGVVASPGAEKKGGIPWKFIIPAIIVGLIAIAGVVLFSSRETGVIVAGHTWEREIRIEQYSMVSESAWCDSMPLGAYGVSSRSEVRSTNRIPDGEDCTTVRRDNGDGTFSESEQCTTRYREEPVYDDRCYYSINRWVPVASAISRGEGLNSTITWPAANVSTGSSLGSRREAGREARYNVLLDDESNDDSYTCSFDDENRWRSMSIESRWTLNINPILKAANCSTLKPLE